MCIEFLDNMKIVSKKYWTNMPYPMIHETLHGTSFKGRLLEKRDSHTDLFWKRK